MSNHVKVPFLFFVAFVLLSIAPRRAVAQDDAFYQNQVRNTLLRGSLLRDALNHNFRALQDGYRYGYIRIGQGNYQTATFHLEAGYVYRFIGACDSDCSDMDFALIGDASQGTIAQDTGPDDIPAIEYEPSRSGDYTIVAKIPKCDGIMGCYWAVQAVWK